MPPCAAARPGKDGAHGFGRGRLHDHPPGDGRIAERDRSARHAVATVLRVAAGFGLGVAVATLLGAVAGYSALARSLLDPTLQALRAIPSIAWVPLFILWFGIFEASKMVLIAVGVFFPVYLGLMGAMLSVDRKIVEVGRIFRLSGPAMIRRILLPAVLPAYVVALRSGLGLGWMFVVAAEFMGAARAGSAICWSTASSLASRRRSSPPSWRSLSSARLADWLIVVTTTAPLLRWQESRNAERGGLNARPRECVGKTYPNGVRALEGVTFNVASGQIVGSGRRLRLRQIDLAAYHLRSRPANPGPGRARRHRHQGPREEIGIMFQEPRLLPWLSVERNVGFGLEDRSARERPNGSPPSSPASDLQRRPARGRANCPAAKPSACRLPAR